MCLGNGYNGNYWASAMKLTELLKSARSKYGRNFGDHKNLHLRELPDGRKQVIRYRGRGWKGRRDSTGVEVIAEVGANRSWADLEIRKV